MIGGYVSVTPLEDEEAELLADLVAARLATEVAVTAWRVGLYPGNTAYSTSSEPGARAFLDGIEATGTDAVARRFRDACRGLPYRRSATGALLERRRRALPRSPLFYSGPVHLVRGEGVWLFDPDDRRYLDCYNNVPVVGHGHPRVVRAVARTAAAARDAQPLPARGDRRAGRTAHGDPAAAGWTPSWCVNSGSEANDLAWRIARAATGRSGAIVTACAYHGLTEATHALSPEEWAAGGAARPRGHGPRARRVPRPLPAGTRRVGRAVRRPRRRRRPGARRPRPGRHVRGPGLHRRRHPGPAARLPGRSGPPGAGAGRRCWWPTRSRPVTAGAGRTCGASRPSGIEPDMVVMGKPMGNGFPVAALVVRSQLLRGRSRGGRAVQHVRRQPGGVRGRARGPGRHRGRGPGRPAPRRSAPTCARAWRPGRAAPGDRGHPGRGPAARRRAGRDATPGARGGDAPAR